MRIDDLTASVKLHNKNHRLQDSEVSCIINDVIDEVSEETLFFNKTYGLVLVKGVYEYNFYALALAQERLEKEMIKDKLQNGTPEEINEILISYGMDDVSQMSAITDTDKLARVLVLLGIYDEDGLFPKGRFYIANDFILRFDDTYVDSNVGKVFNMNIAVRPNLEELSEPEYTASKDTILAGCKFYITDLIYGAEDTGRVNYNYMRYHNKKKELMHFAPMFSHARKDSMGGSFV